MAKYAVSENQSFLDIAVQKLGSVEAAFALAVKNGYSVTDELAAGTKLDLPSVNNADIADYYYRKNILPTTAPTRVFEPIRVFADEFGEEFA